MSLWILDDPLSLQEAPWAFVGPLFPAGAPALFCKAEWICLFRNPDLPKLWYGGPTRTFPSVAFGKHSKMDFKVIQYDARGKFLEWQDVKGATLQLCPNSQKILDAAFTMGTTYRQSCALEVSALLQRTPEPIFYEMFLQFEDEKGNTQLWPVPISNPAIVTNNRAPPLNQALRRFFLVDGLSDRKGNLSNAPASVTLAKELLLSVHLPTTAPGEDPPFSLTVRYATHRTPGIAQVSFSVSYNQSPGSAQLATDVSKPSARFSDCLLNI
ncbi:PREDICTED: meckelin-like [Thamnophis sirtalis]|uniref:Meckelin-like n=1 Tax=Thamnophis sirtalis TaxID=35019 RepID=A0A6I9XGY4_9SAUR|nr:PREDICTED: meckelin-like [Thamnophis sirtalis]